MKPNPALNLAPFGRWTLQLPGSGLALQHFNPAHHC